MVPLISYQGTYNSLKLVSWANTRSGRLISWLSESLLKKTKFAVSIALLLFNYCVVYAGNVMQKNPPGKFRRLTLQ